MLLVQISLTLTICPHHPLLPAGLPDYTLRPYRAFVGKFLLVGQHCHINEKESIGKGHMSLSLLIQQCPVCLVHLIWMVLEIGGR